MARGLSRTDAMKASFLICSCRASICIGVRVLVEVFDEDGFVADFVVDQLVDGAACEKKAIASGAHAFLLALSDVGGGIVRGICRGCVTERFLTEAGAGVAYAKDHRPRCAD